MIESAARVGVGKGGGAERARRGRGRVMRGAGNVESGFQAPSVGCGSNNVTLRTRTCPAARAQGSALKEQNTAVVVRRGSKVRLEQRAWRGPVASRTPRSIRAAAAQDGDGNDDDAELARLKRAMEAAKRNELQGESPGAGLETAEEQAYAAFADLINTSAAQQNRELNEAELQEFAARGGNMWEDGSKKRKSKGWFGDFVDVISALGKGAHIVRQDDGRI